MLLSQGLPPDSASSLGASGLDGSILDGSGLDGSGLEGSGLEGSYAMGTPPLYSQTLQLQRRPLGRVAAQAAVAPATASTDAYVFAHMMRNASQHTSAQSNTQVRAVHCL